MFPFIVAGAALVGGLVATQIAQPDESKKTTQTKQSNEPIAPQSYIVTPIHQQNGGVVSAMEAVQRIIV